MQNSRISPWRQGSILDTGTVRELLSANFQNFDKLVVLVASHDCDIASTSESVVEIIVGELIPALGAATHAKTARRLHIPLQTEAGQLAVEFVASNKFPVSKEALLRGAPKVKSSIAPEDLITFQKWLASRYRRAAFADEFEARLKAKPARLDRRIAKILEVSSEHVLSVLFDVDSGYEVDRVGSDDVYDLGITLLYDGTKDESLAFMAADTAAKAIEVAFEKACSKDGTWTDIRLLYCDAVSDNAMTIAQCRFLKQWRLDYMSLEEVPHEPSLDLH